MFFTKKSLIILLVFIVIISIAANVYSFGKRNDVSNDLREKLSHYESEKKEKEKEINDLKSQISSLEKSKTGAISKEQNDEKKVESPQKDNEEKRINTAYRFIEYAFDNNSETFVTRKKLARNYMTDDLFETLYSSDGVDEVKQNIKFSVQKINVYLSAENEDEAIVHYVLNQEITSSGYKDTVEKYVKLKFVLKQNQLKVSHIESINFDDGGI